MLFGRRSKKRQPTEQSETLAILAVASGGGSAIAEKWIELAVRYSDEFDRQVAEQRGDVVQSFNGEFTAVFPSVRGAFQAAHALVHHQDLRPFPLYCGVHTGELFTHKNKYFSPSFGTARWIATGLTRPHNAKIVLSDSAAALLRPHLGRELALREFRVLVKGAVDPRAFFAVVEARELAARHKSAFISYRRDGGAAIARLIASELSSRDVQTFIDVDDLEAAPFDRQLLDQISACGNFVIVLTPNALDRCSQEGDWVAAEIAQAFETNKNIVPVATEGFLFPDQSVLPEAVRNLARIHAVRYSHEYGTQSMVRLFDSLKSDHEAGLLS